MWDKWDKKYLYIGLTAVGVIVVAWLLGIILLNLKTILGVLAMINSALTPVYLGLIFAYLLNPLMKLIEKRCMQPLLSRFMKKAKMIRSMSRGISIVISIIIGLAIIVGLFWMVIPEVINSITDLVKDMPTYYQNLTKWFSSVMKNHPDIAKYVNDFMTQAYTQLMTWLKSDLLPNSSNLIATVSDSIVGIFSVFFNIFIGIIFAIYLLANKETFGGQAKRLLFSVFNKKHANGTLRVVAETDDVFGKFISGKLLDSLIVGILTFLILMIFNIPYAVLISVLIGVTNIIPFFGQYIGSIPSAFLVFLVSPVKGLIFVIAIVILMQLDGNFISPKILGGSIGIGSFWILFSILFFGTLFGLIGMIIAVPIFAIIYRAIKTWSERRLKKKNMPVDTREYMRGKKPE